MRLSIGCVLVVGALLTCGAARAEGGCLGDLNGDGVISLADLSILLAAYGTCDGDPFYNPVADLDEDGCVDLPDLAQLLSVYGTTCPDAFVLTELAGNSLSAYPYFEYVRSFNANATVEVAIDPTRFPDVVGETADIYVVAAKTAAQWGTNPSLVDVTAGGALAVTFGGGTIQDNTFVVTDPDELDADAGLGMGVGYDVVVDLDQDGSLSEGDFIDGLGELAGLYAVHDVTAEGPLAVTEVIYSGGAWLGQDTYYPTDIASMGELPLVVVSHGNGHNYQWYDHIGYHLASYGYIVMSHQNETGPGVFTASTTTLTNTDYIIANQGTIQGGVLDGHIDSHRITWIGHSRGAEGIAIAYDRIYDGEYTPEMFVLEDIRLLDSMLPVDFLGPDQANPHGVNYHLWTASGDADVSGGPGSDVGKTFHLFERATGFRQSTVVQGTGHGDFHDASGSVFSGPCHIEPKSRVHDIMLGYQFPLVQFYIEGNPAAKDFLWRQWEHFKPIGAPEGPICDVTGGDTVVVNHEFRQAETSGSYIIDDSQDGLDDVDVSSSGGAVTYTVNNVFEGLLRDPDGTFNWTPSDPMNGMTRSRTNDNSRGVVFDWTAPSFYELEVVEGDFTDYAYLSFRGCQQTQHPYTQAVIEDLTFTVTLRDGSGTSSSINIGAYGGGLEDPYQRVSDGVAGWSNEIEVIRIRLTDFLHNGSGLDLSDIAAVRFEFGDGFGSTEGRIGLDAVEVTPDLERPEALPAMSVSLLTDIPLLVSPGSTLTLEARIRLFDQELVPGSALLYYRADGGDFETYPLTAIGDDVYAVTTPTFACGDVPEFYLGMAGELTGPVFIPDGAPDELFTTIVGDEVVLFYDDMETDPGWTTEILGASSGQWQRGIPVDDDGWAYDPVSDSDGSGQCWLTQNQVGNTDVDGGAVRLTSYTIDMSASDFTLAYDYFQYLTDESGTDMLLVEINANDGVGDWTEIDRRLTNGALSWRTQWITRDEIVAAGVTPTATTRLRFTANDADPQSIVESGLDALKLFVIECD